MRRVVSALTALALLAPAAAFPDSTVGGPVATVLAQWAGEQAGRAVTVTCDAGASGENGYVVPGRRNASVWLESATQMHLAPTVCDRLSKYATANPKPSKCQTWRQQAYRAKVVKRVHGKRVVRWVTRYQEVPGPMVPCYPTVQRTASVYAQAMYTVAHETVHLIDFAAGKPYMERAVFEQRATCGGLSLIASLAQRLGATPDDAYSLALSAWERLYPLKRGTDYWTAECAFA